MSQLVARQRLDDLLQKFSTNTSVAFLRVLEAVESSQDPEVSIMMIVLEPQAEVEGVVNFKAISAPRQDHDNYVQTYTGERIGLKAPEKEIEETMQEMENENGEENVVILQRKQLAPVSPTEIEEDSGSEDQSDEAEEELATEETSPSDHHEACEKMDTNDKQEDSDEGSEDIFPTLVLPPVPSLTSSDTRPGVAVWGSSSATTEPAGTWLGGLCSEETRLPQEPQKLFFNLSEVPRHTQVRGSHKELQDKKRRWHLSKREQFNEIRRRWHTAPTPDYVPKPASVKAPFNIFKIQTRPDPRLQPRPVTKKPDECVSCGKQGCLPTVCVGRR